MPKVEEFIGRLGGVEFIAMLDLATLGPLSGHCSNKREGKRCVGKEEKKKSPLSSLTSSIAVENEGAKEGRGGIKGGEGGDKRWGGGR